MNDWQRFNDQFRESLAERNERLRDNRLKRTLEGYRKLIADLSSALTDEGPGWSNEGVHNLRCRVANALPPAECPDWLEAYRDPPIVRSA